MNKRPQQRNATLPFTEVLTDDAKRKIALFEKLQEVEQLLHELRHIYPADYRRSKSLDWWLGRMEPVRPLQGGRVWRFFGLTFECNEPQAFLNNLLWDHRDINDGWVSGEFLMQQLGQPGGRVADVYRKNGIRDKQWGILVGYDGRGMYRVNRQKPVAVSA